MLKDIFGSLEFVIVGSDILFWAYFFFRGDVQYVFAMYYSDGFPKVFKCENELVKATLMYLDDPDAPEGVAFIRWLAVQDYLGEKINWKDLT